MGWTPDTATASVFATLFINAITGIVMLLSFELLRYQQDIFTPRIKRKKYSVLFEMPYGVLQWIRPLWHITDGQIMRSCGMDAYVLLRFIKMSTILFSICGFIGLIVLLPVYSTAPGFDTVVGINRYSMANIEADGDRLWASVIFSYLYTFIFLWLIDYEYANFTEMRRLFFYHGDESFHHQLGYTIQVENIPVEYRSSSKLKELFESLFPGEILFACVSVNISPLDSLVADRKSALYNLELAYVQYETSGELDENRKRPTIKVANGQAILCSICNGNVEEVDSIEYWKGRIEELNEKIKSVQADAIKAESGPTLTPSQEEMLNNYKKENEVESELIIQQLGRLDSFVDDYVFFNKTITKRNVTGTGFVTFRTRCSQAIACQIPILSKAYPNLRIIPAPEPSDIIWSNINTPVLYTNTVSTFTYMAYVTGFLFWGSVIAFIAALSSVDNLSKYLTFINDMPNQDVAVLSGILPVIILLIFNYYLPIVMESVSWYIERRKTISSVQQEVFSWYLLYTTANAILIVVAGSIWNALADIIKSPTSIVPQIAAALPTASVFFMNYTITQTLSGSPLLILRLVVLLFYLVFRIIFGQKSLTRRGVIEGPLLPECINYGFFLPPIVYIFCIAVIYWVIAPILLAMAACFFASRYVVVKYNVMYVYEKKFETGGVFWYGLYTAVMSIVFGSSLAGIAYQFVKEGFDSASFMVPLPAIIIYCWRATEWKYKQLSMHTPFSEAVEIDTTNSKTESNKITNLFSPNLYKQPNFSAPSEVEPYPYRINGLPLFDNRGNLNEIYYFDDPSQYSRDVEHGKNF